MTWYLRCADSPSGEKGPFEDLSVCAVGSKSSIHLFWIKPSKKLWLFARSAEAWCLLSSDTPQFDNIMLTVCSQSLRSGCQSRRVSSVWSAQICSSSALPGGPHSPPSRGGWMVNSCMVSPTIISANQRRSEKGKNKVQISLKLFNLWWSISAVQITYT